MYKQTTPLHRTFWPHTPKKQWHIPRQFNKNACCSGSWHTNPLCFPPCVLRSRSFQRRKLSLQFAHCEMFDATFPAPQAYWISSQLSNGPHGLNRFFSGRALVSKDLFMIEQFVEHTQFNIQSFENLFATTYHMQRVKLDQQDTQPNVNAPSPMFWKCIFASPMKNLVAQRCFLLLIIVKGSLADQSSMFRMFTRAKITTANAREGQGKGR